MRGRLIVIVLAVVAVVVAFKAKDDKAAEHGAAARSAAQTPAPGAISVSFYYSPEKAKLLEPLVKQFNAQRHGVGGRPVFSKAINANSGDVETQVAHGRLKPVLWSPASSFWGKLLNYESDQLLVGEENPQIVRTPLVIAMWKQLADAYGYPRKPMGFGDLARLATGGWAAAGQPAFGPFRYVHTNPDFSTSGLEAVAASYFAAAGKREGLTIGDVARGRAQVRRLERSIVHYGDNTLFIETELQHHGLAYASAAAMEETTLIDFNRTKAGNGPRLVAIYPREGTCYSDSPPITLKGEWVTPELRRAAATFAAFLAKAVTPQLAGKYGFRPADERQKPAGLVTAANGADPVQPTRVLQVPEPKVLAKLKSTWRADRKPANVMLVFDNSLSMGDENKLTRARAGLEAFLREANRRDRVGLTKFSHQSTVLVPIGPMTRNRAKLIAAADRIVPEADTHLRDAIAQAVSTVQETARPDAINAVVVLTDGEDTGSTLTEDQLVQELGRQQRDETGRQVRVFTIAYGAEPDQGELKLYAQASGGSSYAGDQGDVESIYRTILSFF
jgi:Ca-activated chloride channel family protein